MTFPVLAVVSPHTHSQKVADAQWLLSGHNVFKQKFYSDKLDSEYGPLTAAAAYRAKYWLGYPKPDHVFGPVLYAYLHGDARLPLAYKARAKSRASKPKPTITKAELAIHEALTHLNYREIPDNLTMFGKWYGLDGNPWCSMFVSYCAAKAGGKFHYAYVPSVVADAHAGHNGLFVTNSPQPGDAICFDWDNNGLYDHIGFFKGWQDKDKGIFSTVEGNTTPEHGVGNQSNGGGVYERTRYKHGIGTTFVRWN